MRDWITRRSAMLRVGVTTVVGGFGWSARADQSAPGGGAAPAAAVPTGQCVLLPQAVEGPFYFDPKLDRAEIAEASPGAPLQLMLRVVAHPDCKPLAGVRVDVWHADARGAYSGYDEQGASGDISTKGQTFLRGSQVTDADGRVAFKTVYPGWYPGRTPHIHLKLFLGETSIATAQAYFPDDVSQRVYTTREPYIARGAADMRNANDFIFTHGERDGGGTVMTIADDAKLETLVAGLLIGVDQTGDAARRSQGLWRRMFGN